MIEERRHFSIGESSSASMVISEADIMAYAQLIGDMNPVHVDEAFAQASFFRGRIAHGMLVAGLISSVLGNQLPGPGAIYLNQELKFLAPVRPGDEVTARVEVTAWNQETGRVTLQTEVTNQAGDKVIVGEARLVMASRLRR